MSMLEPRVGFNKGKQLYREEISGIKMNELSWCDFSKIDNIENEIHFNSKKVMKSSSNEDRHVTKRLFT